MARFPNRTWFRSRSVAVALVFALAALGASCGGSQPSAGGNSTSTTSDRSSTTTANPQAAAVLAAYRAEWSAFEHAAATANAYDPELPATMVDPLLQQVRRNLLGDQHAGDVGRGTFTLHPRVTAVTASTATVVDCAFSTAQIVSAQTGKPVPPVTPPEFDGVRATLVLTGSTWKVADQSVTDGSCPPGS